MRLKEENLSQNILQTLVYADLFDYPLTLEEIDKFLIGDTRVGVEVVQKTLLIFAPCLPAGRDCKLIDADRDFYFLKGRDNLVEIRKEREKWSKEKWIIAQEAANKLKIIPTIKMIGITGALAMNNADENDDIDFIVVTAANGLWLTRLLIILLSPVLGVARRKPGEQKVKDKICFNLFLDENHLKITPENLFLAHEICQVKPLVNKDNSYERFMGENQWVSNFLPNTGGKSKIKNQKSKTQIKSKKLLSLILRLTNYPFFRLQYLYMKPKITSEKVNLYQAFFHPGNLSNKIQEEFERRVNRLKCL